MNVLQRTLAVAALGVLVAAQPLPAGAAPKPKSAEDDAAMTTPRMNNGKRWRIAYYEGGEYINYQMVLAATIRGLMKLGWIEPAALPPQEGEQTRTLWDWLSTEAKSEYLHFVPDAHYSAKWDKDFRAKLATKVLKRLNTTRDIDLLIAMGTWAGKDFANHDHSTATFVLSTTDPLSAGIIESVEDSGFNHVHAHIDPDRHTRQIQVFHEITGFRKLGVAYEDSVDGRSYAAIESIERASDERDFELVSCYTKSDIEDTEKAEQSVIDCFRKLAKQVDAIYVTEQGGVNQRSIPLLVEVANAYNIPTFDQGGSNGVRLGFLASLSRAGYRYEGENNARNFAMVFNGVRPNEIEQLFREPPKIALNLKTAELIGFDPPVVLLGAADEIFNEIEGPN